MYLNIESSRARTGTLSLSPSGLNYSLHLPEVLRNEVAGFEEGDFIAHKEHMNTFFGQIIAIRHDLDLVIAATSAHPTFRGSYVNLRISDLEQMEVIVSAKHILQRWKDLKFKQ